MRSIVTTYDRLTDDPQAREAFLGLLGIDHDMIASYRNALCDAAAPSRHPRRNPCRCRRADNVTVTFRVRYAR